MRVTDRRWFGSRQAGGRGPSAFAGHVFRLADEVLGMNTRRADMPSGEGASAGMGDLLEQIASHEEAITRQWFRAMRDMSNSPYAALDDETLLATTRRTAHALLGVMRSGDTRSMEETLRASARNRVANGTSFSDLASAWLLYRPAVQQVLADQLSGLEAWDQLIDRVDTVLDWVLRILHDTYRTSAR